MSERFPAGRHVAAVVLALVATLFLRSWLQLRPPSAAAGTPFTADLAYLMAIPLFALLVLPVLLKDRSELGRRLALPRVRSVLIAIAIGLLLRVAWWLQLVAGVASGLYRAGTGASPTPLQLHFACPSYGETALAIVVTVVLMPFIEELVHRGYVQSALRARGVFVAIGISAAVFALFHPVGSWGFAFVAGVVFGIQYWRSGSLWPAILAHATFNALIVLDWRCLQGRWIPAPSEVPVWLPAIVSAVALLACAVAIVALLRSDPGRDA